MNKPFTTSSLSQRFKRAAAVMTVAASLIAFTALNASASFLGVQYYTGAPDPNVTERNVSLTWECDSVPSEFEIHRKGVGETFNFDNPQVVVPGTQLTATDYAVPDGERFWYTATANYWGVRSGNSNVISCFVSQGVLLKDLPVAVSPLDMGNGKILFAVAGESDPWKHLTGLSYQAELGCTPLRTSISAFGPAGFVTAEKVKDGTRYGFNLKGFDEYDVGNVWERFYVLPANWDVTGFAYSPKLTTATAKDDNGQLQNVSGAVVIMDSEAKTIKRLYLYYDVNDELARIYKDSNPYQTSGIDPAFRYNARASMNQSTGSLSLFATDETGRQGRLITWPTTGPAYTVRNFDLDNPKVGLTTYPAFHPDFKLKALTASTAGSMLFAQNEANGAMLAIPLGADVGLQSNAAGTGVKSFQKGPWTGPVFTDARAVKDSPYYEVHWEYRTNGTCPAGTRIVWRMDGNGNFVTVGRFSPDGMVVAEKAAPKTITVAQNKTSKPFASSMLSRAGEHGNRTAKNISKSRDAGKPSATRKWASGGVVKRPKLG